MVTIAHFHYNSAKNVNIGDEAHVLAIQDTLRKQLEDVQIINFPISFLCHYQLPSSLPMSHRLPLSFHNAARILRGTSYNRLIEKINESDLVVIGGGGVYMDHLLPFNMPLLRRITTPIVVFGAGYNRNFGSIDFTAQQIGSIKVLGQKAKLHAVRDANTQEFLHRHGVEAKLVGDPAIFLQRSTGSTPPKTKEPVIGINIAAHGWKQQPRFEAMLVEAYAAMMKTIQKRYGATFQYFVHHPGEHGVIQALAEKGVSFSAVIDSNAKTTKAAYGGTDFAVSMMLHSTILAFGEGKPSICIGYDDKNKSFMDLTSQTERYIRVDEVTPESLIQKVEDLTATLDDSSAQVRAKLHDLRTVYDDFSQRVAALVSAG